MRSEGQVFLFEFTCLRSNQSQIEGLGLSISKRIMEMHGGTIVVRSELNKGSIFSLLFPLKCIMSQSPDVSKSAVEFLSVLFETTRRLRRRRKT